MSPFRMLLMLGLSLAACGVPLLGAEAAPGPQPTPPVRPGAKGGMAAEEGDQGEFLRTVDHIWELARAGSTQEALVLLEQTRQQTTDANQGTRLDAMRTVLLTVSQSAAPAGTSATTTAVPMRTDAPAPSAPPLDLGASTDAAWALARQGRLDEALAVLAAARKQQPSDDENARLDALETVFRTMQATLASSAAPMAPTSPPDTSSTTPGGAPASDYGRVADEAWRLAAANRLDEALAVIGQFQENAADPELARKLEPIRAACLARRNEAYEDTVLQARKLAADGRTEEALALVERFQASTPYPDLAEAMEPMCSAYRALRPPSADQKGHRTPARQTPPAYKGSGLLAEGQIEDLWNDPRFREQFVGSYAMLAATEPKTTEDERRVLAVVLDLLGNDEADEALRLIEGLFSDQPPALEELGITTEAMARWQAEQAALREAAARAEAAAAAAAQSSADEAGETGNAAEPAADKPIKPTLFDSIRGLAGKHTAADTQTTAAAAPTPSTAPAAPADLPSPPRTILGNPSPAFALVAGNARFQRGEHDAAADWFAKAVEGFPTFLRAHRNLGMVRLQQGDFGAAVDHLTRALELGGNDGLLYGLLAYAYTSLGNHLAAEAGYRNAILLQPANADWKLGLARALFGQSRFADAIAVCGQLLDERPEDATLWRLQARAYLALGHAAKAAENYEYLHALGAAEAEDLGTLADIYLKNEALDQATAIYLAALEKDPTQPSDGYIAKAKVLARGHASKEAAQLLAAVEKAAGTGLPEAQRKEILRIQAWIALREGADAEQARLLEEIVRLDPTDGEALISLAQYYGRSGNPEQAVFLYERAADIDAVAARAKIHHAQLLVQQSKYDEAIPLLKSALALGHRDDVAAYLKQVEAAATARR